MSDKHFYKISLQVFIVFAIIIISSVVPDYAHEFFGDTHCTGAEMIPDKGKWGQDNYIEGHIVGCQDGYAHGPTWHWGFRHWMWFFMGIVLFVIQCIRIGFLIHKINKENEANKNL